MKKFLLLPLLFLSAIIGFGQDKIYMKDNSVIIAKVTVVGVSEIKYKKADNLTGPDYEIPKSSVAMIIYENGTHEVINPTNNTISPDIIDEEQTDYQKGKNLIAINYFDLVFKNITFNYTRFFGKNHFSAGISSSAGFTYNDGPYYDGNSFLNFDRDYFHAALTLNYLPIGINKVSYYTGFTFMTGQGGDYGYYDSYPSTHAMVIKKYYGFYIKNGVMFNLTKHFNMKTSLDLGLVDRDMNGDFQSHALFEISAGIRF